MRPFERAGLNQRTLPFLITLSAVFAIALFTTPSLNLGFVLFAGILLVIDFALIVFAPWGKLPQITANVPPFILLFPILLLNLSGETTSYTPLYWLSILWIALYGKESEFIFLTIFTGFLIVLPAYLSPEHYYLTVEIQRSLMWIVMSLVIGFTIRKSIIDLQARNKQLASNEKRTKLITQTSQEAFISINEAGSICDWNPQAETTFGYSCEEAIGKTLSNLIIPKEFREMHKAGMRRFLETGNGKVLGTRLELPALKKDGSEITVEMTISAVEEDGHYIFHAFLHDITDRKIQQTTLQKAFSESARLAAVVEGSEDAIYTYDPKGSVITWNKAAEDLYGYPEKEIIGRSVQVLIPLCKRQEANEIYQAALSGRGMTQYPTVRICKDKREIDVALTVSPIFDQGGTVTGISVIARDISKQKEIERSQAAAEQNLRQTNKDLKEANEIKTHFLAMASHELRTPLTSIYGFSSTMKDRWALLSDQDKHDFNDIIYDQSQRLNNIVNDLLMLSRIERGKLEVKLVNVPLYAAIEDVKAPFKDLDIIVDCDPDLTVLADENYLHQMILNYLNNAIKYGKAPFTIKAINIGQTTRISVIDKGEGVPDHFIPLLFQQFARANEQSGQGTGLGLSIVKGFAKVQHGKAGYTKLADGAEFYIELPKLKKII